MNYKNSGTKVCNIYTQCFAGSLAIGLVGVPSTPYNRILFLSFY